MWLISLLEENTCCNQWFYNSQHERKGDEMAVYTNINGSDEKLYVGKTLNWYERNGYHDSDWYAEVWDDETNSVKHVLYMTTRCGCSGRAELDATVDVLRKVYRYMKKIAAAKFERQNEEQAKKIRKGDTVMIVRGRKVPKGSEVSVFWSGTRFNPYSRMNEERIGVEVDGDRVFINAENAEVIGWENRLVHGKRRKEMVRKETVAMMPIAYRHLFQ